jgi:DNA-binding MarR family transcriptional regulator
VPDHDAVDDFVSSWARERPDLDLAPMATIGRLGRLHVHMGRAIESVFAEHGLQIGEFDVLAALRRSGTPYEMTPTTLARTLMLSPAGMTNRLDRLEAAGLVERRPDRDDRRSSIITLTAAGYEAVDAAVTAHVANEARLLAGLTRAEQRSLDQLLRTLLRHVESIDAPAD